MATDQSVVGLFQTPEQYQLAQTMAMQQQAQQQAANFAQLNNRDRANQSYYLAGSGLGNILGRSIAGEDPMVVRQTQRRELLSKIDLSNPESLVQGIRVSSATDPELSNYLIGKYKELTSIQKEQSIIGKNQAWEAAKTDSEKKRNLLSDVEQDLTEGKTVEPARLNQARLAWAQETKPKTFQDPATGAINTVPGVDVNLFPKLGATIGGVGGGGTGGGARTAGVIETQGSIEAKTKDVQAAQATVKSIDNSLATLDELTKLRENKNWTTNPWVSETMAKFPTQARTQENLVKSQIADKVIGVIGEMKSQSKTGATGFGALNMAELQKLEDTVRKLDPLDPKFDDNIKYVVNKLNESKSSIQTELGRRQQKLSTATGGQSSLANRNPQLKPTEESLIERNMAANRGYSRQQIIDELVKAKRLPVGYQ